MCIALGDQAGLGPIHCEEPMVHLASMIDWHGEIAFSIVEASEEHVRARMPVTPGVLNPLGMVHAGAMIWFADVAATRLAIGDAQIGTDGEGFQLAIDLHAALVGNQRDGELFAEARFVRRGKRVTVVRTRVTGAEGRLLLDMTTTHVPSG
jgi:1,4-dihydroxy-2-naphthoyl-CoA hydrolase